MDILTTTGLGSCIVIILGCAASLRAIYLSSKKPAVAPAGQNTNA